MNFQQLRIIRETARQQFNLTEAANALFTSQSGLSKHIKDFEDELGVEIFVRKGKRFLGLTEPGKALLEIVERMLLDAGNIKKVAENFSHTDQGQLVIATTHTQARYVLPHVVTAFKKSFPRVHLVLHQASPQEIVTMLQSGEADIGIATEALEASPELASFSFYQWHHAVIVPKQHPLAQYAQAGAERLSLETLAEWPLITYHQGFTGRAVLDKHFANANLCPDIVMSALDADVIKTYVELDLGVGIVASVAFNEARDQDLVLLPSEHLFGQNTTRIAVHKGHFLKGYAYRFIELCAPSLTENVVREAVAPQADV
jgi:LysR family cys regulon transcriptional activator